MVSGRRRKGEIAAAGLRHDVTSCIIWPNYSARPFWLLSEAGGGSWWPFVHPDNSAASSMPWGPLIIITTATTEPIKGMLLLHLGALNAGGGCHAEEA